MISKENNYRGIIGCKILISKQSKNFLSQFSALILGGLNVQLIEK